jgi:hypothetical protein
MQSQVIILKCHVDIEVNRSLTVLLNNIRSDGLNEDLQLLTSSSRSPKLAHSVGELAMSVARAVLKL